MTGANNKACLNCLMAAPALKVAKAVLERTNEITSYPWWFICDTPRGEYATAREIIGPFASIDEARKELFERAYYYHRNAFIFCASGRRAETYRTALDAAARLLEGLCDSGDSGNAAERENPAIGEPRGGMGTL
jgi:hypothetical protein